MLRVAGTYLLASARADADAQPGDGWEGPPP